MVLTLEWAMLQEKYGKYKVENKKSKKGALCCDI